MKTHFVNRLAAVIAAVLLMAVAFRSVLREGVAGWDAASGFIYATLISIAILMAGFRNLKRARFTATAAGEDAATQYRKEFLRSI